MLRRRKPRRLLPASNPQHSRNQRKLKRSSSYMRASLGARRYTSKVRVPAYRVKWVNDKVNDAPLPLPTMLKSTFGLVPSLKRRFRLDFGHRRSNGLKIQHVISHSLLSFIVDGGSPTANQKRASQELGLVLDQLRLIGIRECREVGGREMIQRTALAKYR